MRVITTQEIIRLTVLFIGATALLPLRVDAYSQVYYQSYYQSYYQTYYQGAYVSQGSYNTAFSSDVKALQNFSVNGVLSKGFGTFVIDHPLDPLNKLLYHSFVESPDVKNLYDGVATLDANGEAIIRLPNYFEALNKDFRYQVKPINEPMPDLYIKEEVKNNQFTIGGGKGGGKISWQVTGIRHDAYIEANPIIPEVEKGPNTLVDKGHYIFPDPYESQNASKPIADFFTGFWNWVKSVFVALLS